MLINYAYSKISIYIYIYIYIEPIHAYYILYTIGMRIPKVNIHTCTHIYIEYYYFNNDI